jgi:hypothetical protein
MANSIFSIDTFKSAISQGFARGTLFEVILPQISNITADTNFLNLMCESITFPGREISYLESELTIKPVKVANSFTQTDVEISFTLTNDWKVWDYINDWHSMCFPGINNPNESIYVGYKGDYAKDIIIKHYDATGNVRKEIKLVKAFPITLGSMEFSNFSNEILKCSVSFVYDKWYKVK